MGCSTAVNIQIQEDIPVTFTKVKTIGKENPNICHNVLIRNNKTKEEYAYKRIDTIAIGDKEKSKILNDIKTLKTIDHPNIISLKNAYYSEDNKFLYVISEYADCGDLQMKLDEQIEKKEYFDGNVLLNWFMQICFALKYIHKKNILHRNIKPSNIFLMKQDEDNFAKLGDFGVAKILNPSLKHTKTRIESSPKYQAPEILEKKEYSFEADIWSLGVTFYELITLNYPFEGNNDTEIEKNIVKGNIKETPKDCQIDEKFIELIKEMLKTRTDERPTADNILERPILKTRMKCYLEENKFDDKEADSIINNLKDKIKVEEIKHIRVLERDIKDIIIYEKNEENEKNRADKARYDFYRQLTNINEDLKKSKTFPIKKK